MTGTNDIAQKVLSRLVNQAALSVPGVQELSGSWTDLGTKSYPRCDLRCDPASGTIHVDSYVAVSWPSPVASVASEVRETIVTWLKEYANYRATRVNVTVEQTVVGAQRVTREAVAEHPRSPVLREIRVPEGDVVDKQPALPAETPLRPIRVRPIEASYPIVVRREEPLKPIRVNPTKVVSYGNLR